MKFKVGYIYEVEFLDHCAGGSKKPVYSHAVGYVLEDHEEYVYLSSWIIQTNDLELFNSNLESFVVLKSAIKKRALLCKTKRR